MRLTGLSSTSRTFLPFKSTDTSFSFAGSVADAFRSANLSLTKTVNSVPSPFLEATEMRPPIISTMFFVIAIPRPVPETPDMVLFSSRVNGLKIVLANSSLMPMPLSLQRIS